MNSKERKKGRQKPNIIFFNVYILYYSLVSDSFSYNVEFSVNPQSPRYRLSHSATSFQLVSLYMANPYLETYVQTNGNESKVKRSNSCLDP